MKNKILTILIIFLFVSLFILLNWNSFNAPFERDEGEYAYSAWLLRTGDTPYKDSFLQKPPLIIYTYLAGQIISPWAVWPPRVLASIFVFLTAILIYIISKKEWGEIAGVFSAFIFLPMISFPVLTPFSANTEKFMILPMVGLLALFVYFKETQKQWPYIFAGILATIAIFYKPICLPVILFIIIFWLFKVYKSRVPSNFYIVIRPFLLICISTIITTSILLIPFFKVLPKFFEEVFLFNFSYINSFSNPFINFGGYLSSFFHYWWILIILPFGLFFEKPKDIFFYISLLIISLLTIFKTPSGLGHYYLIIMPFLALICGALYVSILKLLTNKQKIITTIIVLPLVLYIILFPFKEQFSMNGEDLSKWVYGTVNPFVESRVAAEQLARVTDKDDFVFVAGSEPQIYYYSNRKSQNRFIITYPLNLNTPYREEYQRELISDLEKYPPKAIVLSQRSYSGLWEEGSPRIFIDYFNDLISNNYIVIGGYVWDTQEGHWQEPINEKEIENASLILLLKKK